MVPWYKPIWFGLVDRMGQYGLITGSWASNQRSIRRKGEWADYSQRTPEHERQHSQNKFSAVLRYTQILKDALTLLIAGNYNLASGSHQAGSYRLERICAIKPAPKKPLNHANRLENIDLMFRLILESLTADESIHPHWFHVSLVRLHLSVSTIVTWGISVRGSKLMRA